MILRVKKKTKKPQRANNEQLFFSTSNTHSLQIISTKGCGGNSPQGTFPKGFQVHVGGWLYKLQLALSYSLQSNGQYLHPNLCLLWPQFNCCNASKLHPQRCLYRNSVSTHTANCTSILSSKYIKGLTIPTCISVISLTHNQVRSPSTAAKRSKGTR